MQFAPAACVEQTQFDLLGMRREDCKVDAFTVPGRAERKGLALIGVRAARADHSGASLVSGASQSTLCGGT